MVFCCCPIFLQEEDESQDLYAGKTATAAALDDFVVQKAVDPPRVGLEWPCKKRIPVTSYGWEKRRFKVNEGTLI